jgi:acyl-coenzyme A thioesterase PaaI-like protein
VLSGREHERRASFCLRRANKAMTKVTGKVRAEAKVLSFGRRAAFAEGKLIDSDGRLLASATSTLLVIAKQV